MDKDRLNKSDKGNASTWDASLINLIYRPSGSIPLPDFNSEIICWTSVGFIVTNEKELLGSSAKLEKGKFENCKLQIEEKCWLKALATAEGSLITSLILILVAMLLVELCNKELRLFQNFLGLLKLLDKEFFYNNLI